MHNFAYTRTFGCQQNEADTERLRGALIAQGYTITDDLERADLALVNTCAVREHAESRAFGHIGELKHWKRVRPDRVLVVCGCMAEQDEVKRKIKQSYPHVDLVFGTKPPPEFQTLLEDIQRKPPPSASVPIISGCDNFCSYCVVPYVRGHETSRDSGEILTEIRGLLTKGYNDFQLLGQNVNSYNFNGLDFADLLKNICALEGDFWVRFMTSHPKDCSYEVLKFMAGEPKMARHLHLPVQAGSDKVLNAMNRRYTSAHYLMLIERARKLMPDLTVTSDIIVGFPGETEEDFEQTLALVERVEYDSLFTFIYSPRRDTPAANMEQLPRKVKQERFDRLLELQNAISNRKHAALVGTTQRVLVDGFDPENERPLSGRTSGGRLVRLSDNSKFNQSNIGKFIDVQILGHNSWNLFG